MHLQSNKLNNILGLYLLGALAFAGVMAMFVIKPQIAKGQELSANTAKTNADIAKLNRLNQDTEVLRTNYLVVKTKRDQILSQLPVKSEEERLLVLLGTMAQSSGVVLSSFSPGNVNAAAGSSLSIYPAGISITGTYQATQAFLQKVEESARFIDISTISLAATTQNKAQSVSATLSLQAYYQQQAAATAPGVSK